MADTASGAFIRPIVINYKGAEDTIECLHALAQQVDVNLRPLVLDNASGDGSVEKIRAAHPEVEIIESEENLGFSGGNNFAIQHAMKEHCDYLFLVNNDIGMEKDCISQLLSYAVEHPEAGVVGPAIYRYDQPEEPWFTGSVANIATGDVDHQLVDVRKNKVTTPFEVPWTTGCAMLVRRKIMQEIEGFDSRFFCYFEDVDWCFRAKKKGYKCILCPAAILYHKAGATTNAINHNLNYYMTRNRMLFMSKNASFKHRIKLYFSAVKKVAQWTKHILSNKADCTQYKEYIVYRTAVIDFISKRYGRCPHTWFGS